MGICGTCWNPTSIKSFINWEMEDVERLLLWLGEGRVIEGVEDMVRWIETNNGLFLEELLAAKDMFLSLGTTWGMVLTLNQCRKEDGPFQAVVPFVKRAKRQWTISSFIVQRQGCYRSCFFSFWSFLGNVFFGAGFPLRWRGAFLVKDK